MLLVAGSIIGQTKLSNVSKSIIREVNEKYPHGKKVEYFWDDDKKEMFAIIDKNERYVISATNIKTPIEVLECMNKKYPTYKLEKTESTFSKDGKCLFKFIFREKTIFVDEDCEELSQPPKN
jgi:hypothetical protein